MIIKKELKVQYQDLKDSLIHLIVLQLKSKKNGEYFSEENKIILKRKHNYFLEDIISNDLILKLKSFPLKKKKGEFEDEGYLSNEVLIKEIKKIESTKRYYSSDRKVYGDIDGDTEHEIICFANFKTYVKNGSTTYPHYNLNLNLNEKEYESLLKLPKNTIMKADFKFKGAKK